MFGVPPALLVAVACAAYVQVSGSHVAVVTGLRKCAESEFGRLDSPELCGLEGVARTAGPVDLEVGLHHDEERGVLPVTGHTAPLPRCPGAAPLRGGRTLPLPHRPRQSGRAHRRPQWQRLRHGSLFPGSHVRVGIDWIAWKPLLVGGDVRWIQESQLEYGGYDLDGPAFTLRVGFEF